MGFITFILLLVNLAIVFAIDYGFWQIGWQLGLSGLVAVIAFLISYSLAAEIALSPLDFFWNSDWGIFCKKLTWAWSMGLVFFAIAYLVLAYTSGDPLGIIPT